MKINIQIKIAMARVINVITTMPIMMVMMMMMVNSPLERETEDMFFREVSNHRLQSEFLEFQNFGTFLFAQMFTNVSYPCLPNLSERSLHDPKRIRMHFC